MSVGKSSIQRVSSQKETAKTVKTVLTPAPETEKILPKAAPKKAAPAGKKTLPAVKEAKPVSAVKEKKGKGSGAKADTIVQITDDMPTYLL
ncbi:MAG: hypothetical protein MJ078_05290 [Clostridia bacterium]|nr:hypothetical protein [Clostridia bacterium]